LGIELAGRVAVVAAAPLELLADQRAVVRLVVVHAAQGLPLSSMPWPVVHEYDERLGASALGFEHAIEKVVELCFAKGTHRGYLIAFSSRGSYPINPRPH